MLVRLQKRTLNELKTQGRQKKDLQEQLAQMRHSQAQTPPPAVAEQRDVKSLQFPIMVAMMALIAVIAFTAGKWIR